MLFQEFSNPWNELVNRDESTKDAWAVWNARRADLTGTLPPQLALPAPPSNAASSSSAAAAGPGEGANIDPSAAAAATIADDSVIAAADAAEDDGL